MLYDELLTSEVSPSRAEEIHEVLASLALPGIRLSVVELERVVRELEARPHLYMDLVVDSFEERWSVLLLRAANYEVRLLSWEREQFSDWHDHGGSSGAFAVLAGELAETFRVLDGVSTASRAFATGDVGSFGPTHVHDVTYRSGGPAVSVHAYSPPLTNLTYYDKTPRGFVAREIHAEERRGTVVVGEGRAARR